MFDKKIFIYTILAFLFICIVSYTVYGQEQKLSLKEAVSLAVVNNRQVKVADIGVEKAKQQIRIAKSYALPSAGISAQLGHYFSAPVFFGFDNNGNSDKIPYGRFGGKDQAAATLSVMQPLYNPVARPSLQYAKLQEQESRIAVTGIQTEVISVVKQTYLQVLVLHERIKLQRESLNRNQKALDDAKSLLAQGKALRVDTLRAYTSVRNLEPDLLKLSYAIEVGKLQLKTLIGIDSLQEIELSDSLVLPPVDIVPPEEEVYRYAVANRPDLQTKALRQQLNDQQIKLAAAGKKPLVSLLGQYQVQTQANQFNYFNSYYPTTPFVGAQLSIPLFSGFSNDAKIKQARMEKKQSAIVLTDAYEQLKTEVRQVLADIKETAARMQTRTNVKETAQLSYEITQYRYAKGVASRLELTDAELALSAAQSNYLEAVFDYLSARIALDKTMAKREF